MWLVVSAAVDGSSVLLLLLLLGEFAFAVAFIANVYHGRWKRVGLVFGRLLSLLFVGIWTISSCSSSSSLRKDVSVVLDWGSCSLVLLGFVMLLVAVALLTPPFVVVVGRGESDVELDPSPSRLPRLACRRKRFWGNTMLGRKRIVVAADMRSTYCLYQKPSRIP